jgi:hypothetical protein
MAGSEVQALLPSHFFNGQVSKGLCHDLVQTLQRAFHIAFFKLYAQTIVRNTVG